MSLNPADHDTTTTVDHSDIKRWVEHHDGVPAQETASESHPVRLQLIFPADTATTEQTPTPETDHTEEISWTRFFERFEDENLALRYRDLDEGEATNLNYEFVDRATADVNEENAVDELLGKEVMSPTATMAANVDEGMNVVSTSGETVGIVSKTGGGQIYVEPDPGLTDKIKIKLNWGDTLEDNEDVYTVPETQIERIEGEEVRIHHPE
jgi:hypothetical protein